MKHGMRYPETISGPTIVRKSSVVFLSVLFVIGFAGIPEDISTWRNWLKKVLLIPDYLSRMIMGAVVTVLAYEISFLLIGLFRGIKTRYLPLKNFAESIN